MSKLTYDRCRKCNGTGRIKCCNCKGYGVLKRYNQLTVRFINYKDIQLIKKNQDLPDFLIYDCPSRKLMSQQAFKLYPIKSDLGSSVEDASINLLNSHSTKFASSTIIAQVSIIFV